MFTIAVNEVPYHIPTRWEEMTLGKYSQYLNMLPPPDSNTEFAKWQFQVVARFADIPLGYIDTFPYPDTVACFNILSGLLTTKPEEGGNFEAFTFRSVEYKCAQGSITAGKYVPMRYMSTGEFVDGLQIQQDIEAAANDVTRFPLLIATLYRPDGEIYDADKTHGRAELFAGLTMDIVFGCAFFLSKRLGSSNASMLSYLKSGATTGTVQNMPE